jgi:hypothetical protein
VDTAAKNGRSITQQTELALEQGIKTRVFIGYSAGEDMTGFLDKIYNSLDNTAVDLASNISARAGTFLEIKYPGRSKDERIARDLGISAGMAKMLRQGRAWTVARLDQAMELWPTFRGFVFPAPRSDQIANRLEELAAGFSRLANEFAELRQELRAERPLRDKPPDEPAKDRAS